MKNKLPRGHIVDRYFEPLKSIGITNDGKGLDFFISSTDEVNISNLISTEDKKFIALVVGGSYYTKQIPLNKLNEICLNSSLPLILLGSQQDSKIAEALCSQNKNAINVCGKFSLLQTASILKQAEWVITPDTGLMHIASAYCKKIISMWGNTVPEFGMSAYNPNSENIILENKNLSCRPCSKLGYHQCPLRHFDCMNKLDVEFVKDLK